MNNNGVWNVVGAVIAALLIAVCILLALWIICVVGQFVFSTFGVGGLVLLCTLLGCAAMMGSQYD